MYCSRVDRKIGQKISAKFNTKLTKFIPHLVLPLELVDERPVLPSELIDDCLAVRTVDNQCLFRYCSPRKFPPDCLKRDLCST